MSSYLRAFLRDGGKDDPIIQPHTEDLTPTSFFSSRQWGVTDHVQNVYFIELRAAGLFQSERPSHL
jgi:hypothetical protein